MKKQLDKRSIMIALGFLIHSTEESFNLLCRLNIKLKQYLKNPSLAKNREDYLSPHDLAVCMSALKSHICTLIFRMFDTRKGTISFINIEWLRQAEIKTTLRKIRKEKVVEEIIRTRHTFISHVDPNVQDIISVDRICESNLSELLQELNAIYNLCLLINNLRPGEL